MQCFRLAHAGLVLEDQGNSLLIDIGDFTSPDELAAAMLAAKPIAALVITHEHSDHWTPGHVAQIRAAAPQVPIFTTASTAAALAALGITDATVVSEGEQHTAGPFTLDFYGRRHEVLHSSIQVIDNIGVKVNDTLAWGGDSLTRAPFTADVLGVPIGSPWSNIAQVMDFVLTSAPKRAFLTHDGMLSARGLGLFTSRVQWCLDQYGGELLTLPSIDGDHAARLEV